MPMYHFWNDTMFYAYSAAFAGCMACLIYCVQRWLKLKNAPQLAEEPAEAAAPPYESPAQELPATAAANTEPDPRQNQDLEKTIVVSNMEELIAKTALEQDPAAASGQELSPPAGLHTNARAEEFVKGIYGHMAGIDARLGAIEKAIAEGGGNRHFAVKFLEGILEDYETLSVEKIKTRVEYLLSDLKENPADKKI